MEEREIKSKYKGKGGMEILDDMDKRYSNSICIREVNENLRRVQLDMELTRPLRQLNENCDFKQKYEEWCDNSEGINHFNHEPKQCKICGREFIPNFYIEKCCCIRCKEENMRINRRRYKGCKTPKEYYQKHYIKNKEKYVKRGRKYYLKNRERILESKRIKYAKDNRSI